MGNRYEPEIHRINQKVAKKEEKRLSLTAIGKMQGNVSPNGILHCSLNKQSSTINLKSNVEFNKLVKC